MEYIEGRMVSFPPLVPQAVWPEPETVDALPVEELPVSTRARRSLETHGPEPCQSPGN